MTYPPGTLQREQQRNTSSETWFRLATLRFIYRGCSSSRPLRCTMKSSVVLTGVGVDRDCENAIQSNACTEMSVFGYTVASCFVTPTSGEVEESVCNLKAEKSPTGNNASSELVRRRGKNFRNDSTILIYMGGEEMEPGVDPNSPLCRISAASSCARITTPSASSVIPAKSCYTSSSID
ncbi:hypothetical protein DPMN_139626 [Dreissena polymorpha]|uniref:Uncharacterized protein n=1 Tax=Dreissena polymorpha TaxID=45954 RepID=A0A9D4JIA1_DREPO|nr:hypothetical protein DPMN_139626 [Dreissena polymorpha]